MFTVEEVALTFANGQSLSTEYVECKGNEKAIGIFFEAGYNTTNCTFQMYTFDKTKSAPVLNSSSSEVELTIDQTNGSYVALDPTIFAGISVFKVRRGTVGTPFTTGAEDTVIKVLKRVY